jgi:hypothetical protein
VGGAADYLEAENVRRAFFNGLVHSTNFDLTEFEYVRVRSEVELPRCAALCT